ncbi:MAG: conjugal transfer protein TraX, partial [Treponema sp.]|nr:conjugal transfer protein TraX [Treponema sp.]
MNPRTWQFLSGTGIKIIGIVLMVIDHVHQMFIDRGAPGWMSWFGRPVATMFLFLCAEGFFYTRSKKRYMLQFLGGFIFMSVMNQILSAVMFMEHITLINNIFGTLFMAVYYMWMIDLIREGARDKRPVRIISAIGGLLLPLAISLAVFLTMRSGNYTAALIICFIPNPLSVEGGFVLVFMGAAFYLLRKYRPAQAALVLIISALTWYSSKDTPGDFHWLIFSAIIPIFLYNGKR